MGRREFITLLGGVAAAWPLAARAQQPERMRRIGVLIPFAESDAEAQAQVTAFREGLQQLGWTAGGNVQFEYRWAAGEVGQIRTFAKELVELQPDVILARTTPVTAALLSETRTIPITFVVVSDPVGDGFVASLVAAGEATSPGSPMSRKRWAASGWSCSRGSLPSSRGWPSCSIRRLPRGVDRIICV